MGKNHEFIDINSIGRIDYKDLRRSLLQENKLLPSEHPCCKGKGNCCERNIPVSEKDVQIISGAIQRGDIPRSVIAQAKERAATSKQNRCPFLNPRNECSIYPYRPIVCIEARAGGTAHPKQLEATVQQYAETGTDPGIPVCNTRTSHMCAECHQQMADAGMKFSSRGVRNHYALIAYLSNNPSIPMPEVVAKLPLPKRRK